MTPFEREVLADIAEGMGLLSEYDPPERWQAANRLVAGMLATRRGLYTACAKYVATDAGREALTAEDRAAAAERGRVIVEKADAARARWAAAEKASEAARTGAWPGRIET